MKKMMWIAWKDVKIRIRDRKGFLLSILMPLIFIAILGMALSNVMDPGTNSMPHIKLAVHNDDAGKISTTLIDQVFQSKDLMPYFTLENEPSVEGVKRKVESGQADVGICIPANFTDALQKGLLPNLEILQDPGKTLMGQIVTTIVTSYIDRVHAVVAASQAVVQSIASTHTPLDRVVQQVLNEIQKRAMQPNVTVKDQIAGAKPISAIQYYAVAQAVMFLLFNASAGAESFLNERSAQTFARLSCTPTRKSTILLGKFFGTLFFSVLQFAVLLVATRLFFGVSWGDQPLQTFVIGIVYSVAISGFALLLAAFLEDEKAADFVISVGVYLLSALGGSMIPIYLFPEVMRTLAHVSPNTWALTSFLDIMAGTSWRSLMIPISVLLGMGMAALTFGTLRLRKN
jgi:ABC-2 type transport system permease protein